MPTNTKSKRRESFLAQARRELRDPWFSWWKDIGLTEHDLARCLADDAERAAALSHKELRQRSGRTLRQVGYAMDARQATARRIERTATKNLTITGLDRYLTAAGLELKLYVSTGRRCFRMKAW